MPLPAPVSLSTKLSVPPDGVPPAVTVFGVVAGAAAICAASSNTVKVTSRVSPGANEPPEIKPSMASPSKPVTAAGSVVTGVPAAV